MSGDHLYSSNPDTDLKIQNQNLLKLQGHFNGLQIDQITKLKEKNELLENKLNIMEKDLKNKIQKPNSDTNLNIEELKQDFQKIIDELKNENSKQISELKEIIEKKDEKIISLENKVKQNFVQSKNKWLEIDNTLQCCDNDCINTNKPTGYCIEGNGFISLNKDGISIKYNCAEDEEYIDKPARLYAENYFEKPKGFCINYSLLYFEIKCKFEGNIRCDKNWMNFGLRNCNNDDIVLMAEDGLIKNGEKQFKVPTFSWNNNDTFGCGLVYPPTKMSEKFPYIFFTQNGKQIGKAVLLSEGNCDYYKPLIHLRYCSEEYTNFGCLKSRHFVYDISKHFVLQEFYSDSDA
uniref:SPRY domain-containing protein n=1 Tax=Meloidogyne hapla TaxID=6305 RepID=A0A1I8C2G0_MELHA